MKTINEMVWPVEGYTDKLHSGINIMFSERPWLSFTTDQMLSHLTKGFKWLILETPRQKALLKQIIRTGIKKLIQTGKVQKVTSDVSVEDQWIATKNAKETGYTSITSVDDVAKTPSAKSAIRGRALNAVDLWRLNQQIV